MSIFPIYNYTKNILEQFYLVCVFVVVGGLSAVGSYAFLFFYKCHIGSYMC